MFEHIKPVVTRMWRWFRRRSLFSQLILVLPILCAIALTVLVGNMGLALMGTAIALYAPVVGWIGGFIALILAKAASIIFRDKRRSP
ncbi:hypothetical protein [Roseovarius sp. ZX-A-9]|uniref:hypothetical protein n=1 Tax=Roseovarius sp. ZX-A-9 TaxID=3014783 RepID=UPI002331159C|nr:hypothetical protein [Roseovarius sp. ZX-A-9]